MIVVLTLHTSWQQDSFESLNDTLEKLIRQTEPVAQINSSEKNHSRILYFSSPSVKKETHTRTDKNDPYGKTSHSSNMKTDIDNQVSITDLLYAIGLKPSKTGQNADKDQVLKDIANTIKQGLKINSKFEIDDLKELLEKPTLMEKKPSKENYIPEEDIIRRASETENNLLNKYPEIIVDRITYPNKSETANITKTVTVLTEEKQGQENEEFDRNYPMELAKELKSLLSEVQQMKKVETAANNGHSKKLHLTQYFHGTSHLPAHGFQQQPMHGSPWQRIHGYPCGNVHKQYASPCALYHAPPSFDRSIGPHHGANVQENTWGAHNARQEMLMRISREQKLNRIRFITDLINNMMSRFVYRPLYSEK